MSDDVKKIECEQAIRLMLEYLDNELQPHDHESMHEHLESCRSCYTRMEFEQRLKGMVQEVKSQQVPEHLNTRIKKILKDY